MPAPCEEACTLTFARAVTIKQIEKQIGDWSRENASRAGDRAEEDRKKIAIVGSGPRPGVRAAVARAVTRDRVERDDRIGGLLRYASRTSR